MTTAANASLADDALACIDPADPHPIYAELRERAPIHWSRSLNGWVLTRYDDVRRVLNDDDFKPGSPATHIARLGQRGGPALTHLTAVLASIERLADAERAPSMRRLFFSWLGSWRKMGLAEKIAQRASALLAAGQSAGHIDLGVGYGRKLAAFTVCSVFGLSESEHAELSDSVGILSCLSFKLHPLRELVRMESEAARIMSRFRALIQARRIRMGDDGLSSMLRAADADGGWTDDELAGSCAFFLGAARETTATAIAACAVRLLKDPLLLTRLRAEPAIRAVALRELLRLITPFQFVGRRARRDKFIAGQEIRSGQSVCVLLAAANRDPSVFPEPDKVDLDRQGPEPLTFGSGEMRCLGEQLGRLEVGLAIDRLLEHPDLRLSGEPVVWGKATQMLELRHVPAVFGPMGTGRG
ncbi:MAG TPA: cytochrome P450 [Caulobacteraceae bacterium]|nr:cytochrome P450 [Caulobacteraceae bacterium]